METTRFEYPNTVEAAVALLGDPDSGAVAVGGGTALTSEGRRGARVLVDVTRCGLGRIEVDGDAITVGAAVRVADLRVGPGRLPNTSEGRLLEAAAQGIASQLLRNSITLGGNIVHLCRWADMPVALLALDAVVHVRHAEQGALDVPIGYLVAEHPLKVLPPGALVTGVTVPVSGQRRGAVYRRFRTTATDYPLLTVACVVGQEAGTCNHAAVALGALSPRPVRAKGAETLLKGSDLSAERLAEAAAGLPDQVTVAPNFRMAPEVRKRILVPVGRRAMEAAAAAARERA